jgi:hypothetical protein
MKLLYLIYIFPSNEIKFSYTGANECPGAEPFRCRIGCLISMVCEKV